MKNSETKPNISVKRGNLAAIFATALLFICSLINLPAADHAAAEAKFYPILTLPIPEGITLEAGALQIMPSNRVAVSTRLGDVYLIDGAFDNPPAKVKFNLYASGLHEVLGLALREKSLYATQRGEVTRMEDLDGDGRADLFQTVSDGWGIGGDYHEYAFGSKFDRDTNIWVVLCLTGSFTSENLYRGWCLRIGPGGKVTPTCSGIRSPGGIGTNSLGEMFYTDNQGPWNGACALKHLVPGGFMGNPSGNKWYEVANLPGPSPLEPKSGSRMHIEAKKIPELIPPAVLFRGGKPFALQRMLWNGQTPFEIHEMRARPDGFELTFTQPVDPVTAGKIDSYKLETFTYIYRAEYGSPEVDQTTPTIKNVSVAKNGLSAQLSVDGLQEGHIHELHLPGVRSTSGAPLLHDVAYYTMNYIPAK
ncbi:MAG: hypothetical protein HY043_06470 [Verrucomicrobia bacterium]|nr:hypothetical protein [Verrucomicrobiota bacterium]